MERGGIDKAAETFARQRGIETIVFPADWERYGKRAGALRNQQIVDYAHRVVAFWDGKSPGTQITIGMALKKGIPVDVRKPDGTVEHLA